MYKLLLTSSEQRERKKNRRMCKWFKFVVSFWYGSRTERMSSQFTPYHPERGCMYVLGVHSIECCGEHVTRIIHIIWKFIVTAGLTISYKRMLQLHIVLSNNTVIFAQIISSFCLSFSMSTIKLLEKIGNDAKSPTRLRNSYPSVISKHWTFLANQQFTLMNPWWLINIYTWCRGCVCVCVLIRGSNGVFFCAWQQQQQHTHTQ